MCIEDYRDQVRFSEEKMVKVNLWGSHRLFADLYCLLPEQSQRVHTHEGEDKIYFLLEGEATCTIGEIEHRLESGGVCIAPAGAPHGVRADSGKAVLLVIMAPHPSIEPPPPTQP